MRFALLVGASTVSLALSAGSMAIAQPAAPTSVGEENTVEDVVVTARRREERLKDIPAAGSVIDQRAIADQGGMVTLSDLAANLPSVNFANTSTAATSEVSMRGSGTARATTAEAGVGLYRSGVYIGGGRLGGRTFTRMDFFDVDRIEALRGVQSALYGRNAIGGAINVITTQPKFEDSGSLKAKAGSKEHYEGQIVQNFAVNDMLAFRLGVDLLEQRKGYFYNPVQNTYFDAQSAQGFRGQGRLNAGPLDVTLMAEHSVTHLPALHFQIFIPPGTTGFPNGAIQPQYEYGWNARSVAKQRESQLLLSGTYDLGFATLSGVASRRLRYTAHGFDADGVDPVFLAVIRAGGGGLTTDANQETLQEDDTRINYFELHLTDKGGSRVKWLVGAEHLTIESIGAIRTTRTPTPANLSPGTESPSLLETTPDAVFGSLGFDVTSRFNVTGEVRHSRETKSLVSNRFDLRTGLSSGARFVVDASTVEEHTSYSAVASYRLPWRDLLLYGRVGNGFRAGGFNTDLGDPRAPNPVIPAYNAETSDSYEIGLKGVVFGGLFITADAFETTTDDVLVQTTNGCAVSNPVCPVAATVFLRNAGEARTRGYELEGSGRWALAGGRLRLSAGTARLIAKVTAGPDAGRSIPQVANWTANGNVNYEHPIGWRMDGFVNVQVTARWGGVQEIEQTPALVDYTTTNLRAGVRRGSWEIGAYVNNIVDDRFLVFIGPSARRWNNPRVIGVDLSTRW